MKHRRCIIFRISFRKKTWNFFRCVSKHLTTLANCLFRVCKDIGYICLHNIGVQLIIFFIAVIWICKEAPDYYLEKYQTSTYMESGQIGDVVGGTTSPLIAIIASLFTFLAFWMQYKANENQRKDISLDHFESNFYEMLHIHRANLKELRCGEKRGRDAIYSYCYKLKILYCLVHAIVRNLSEADKKMFYEFYIEKNFSSYEECETVVAYNIFFHGANLYRIFDCSSKEARVYNKLTKIIENYELSRIIIKDNLVYNDEILNRISDDIYRYLANSVSISEFELDLLPDTEINIPDSLLLGYNDKLGVYYRQLFQIVKFVNQKKYFSEENRYFYLRMIRSQLSDHEQILLYYNGLSLMGKAWNTVSLHIKRDNVLFKKDSINDWRISMGMIARYRLIKNVPASFRMFGYIPEIKYRKEIKQYKDHGIEFFEFERSLLG